MLPIAHTAQRFILTAFLAATFPIAALAHPTADPADAGQAPWPGGEFRHGPGRPDGLMPPYLHGVKLTEEQKDRIFAILHAQMPQMRELGKALRKSHEDLRELALSDRYDENQARSIADAGARAGADMALLRARSDRQILSLLTPEQRSALDRRHAH